MDEPIVRRWNWPLWAGFVLNLSAFFSYFLLFVQFPATRNFPWANLLLFVVAEIFLGIGLLRAFGQSQVYRGKIVGPFLSGLSTLVLAGFVFVVFVLARRLPISSNAPHVGTKAPEFTLLDTSNKPVSLTELLTTSQNGTPTKGLLLVFYRGYW
jgi:hypothetical protein